MKQMSLIVAVLFYCLTLYGQSNTTLHYQGIARNTQGAPLAGVTIAVRLNIKDALNNGNTLYSETKSVATNAFGVYSISINDGTGVRTGDFNAINWSIPRYLQTEIDLANGTAFADMGTQQMQSVPHALSAKNLDGVANPQEGDLLEYQNGAWLTKPKTKRYHVAGGLGWNPSGSLNFIGLRATITVERDNPIITISLTKAFGSNLLGGGYGLNLNLGYQKVGGPVTEFDAPDQNGIGRITSVKVPAGTRIPITLSGTYQTNFKAGETYDVGIVGVSPNFYSWNDNGYCKGYVEVSY
ncbi:hypothetical protein [Dyadobacter sp. BHUBP1]|uniref:hypothetical protein n=1 Tax=Dyadobacter sp. BHUBP1 TaxID=3424178 RepID=UPI003D337F4E